MTPGHQCTKPGCTAEFQTPQGLKVHQVRKHSAKGKKWGAPNSRNKRLAQDINASQNREERAQQRRMLVEATRLIPVVSTPSGFNFCPHCGGELGMLQKAASMIMGKGVTNG